MFRYLIKAVTNTYICVRYGVFMMMKIQVMIFLVVMSRSDVLQPRRPELYL